jgi:hypothetical protein
MSSTHNTNLDGEKLIETLVTLTGLPENLAHQELDQILDMSGHSSESRTTLTMDELRAALLTYLEALAPDSLD